MPGVKGQSKAGDEVLDMIRRHGSVTNAGVAVYCDISFKAAIKRLERLRNLGLVTCEISMENGKQYVWKEVENSGDS